MSDSHHESKTALIDAAIAVIRTKGYTATRIEDICHAAELTKGSFFHHFKSKEDLAVAAADRWASESGSLFASAAYQELPHPVDRLLGYIEFRKALLKGPLPEITCLAGTMIQEVYETHPAIRDACEKSISEHIDALKPDIEEAVRMYCVDPPFSAESLALYFQAVLQGGFVLAKAKQDSTVTADCLDHLRRYLDMLFAGRQPAAKAARST
jgi:TetR/AcrR family transcriptional regulator, transcriptional repressor for nem operon